MKRKILSLLTLPVLLAVIVISVYTSVPVYAEAFHANRVVDGGDLLTDEEESRLMEKLDEISERQQFDVVVVTAGGLDGKSAEAWADDYYDFNGYGFGEDHDGCLLLVSMEERDYHISTTGFGIEALTDYGMQLLDGYYVPKLSAGNYYDAFVSFADGVDEFVTEAKQGHPVDIGNSETEEIFPVQEEEHGMPGAGAAAGAVGGGLVTSLLATQSMRRKLKTVRRQQAASQYFERGSMHVSVARDDFMYRNVSRTPRPKDNDRDHGGSSVHIGSSGISHGGHGGKF